MNLIEQLGGYGAAKEALHRLKSEKKDLISCGASVFVESQIVDALIKYRRQHNIFEVGDKVVHHKFSNMKIYEVCEISGDLLTVFYDRKTHSFKTDVMHATDAEIEAGKRLGVGCE